MLKCKAQLSNLVTTAGKIIKIIRQANNILDDPSHVLHSQFELLKSGRTYRAAFYARNLYKNSFISQAISFINRQLEEVCKQTGGKA